LNKYLQVRVEPNPQKKEGDNLPSHYVFVYKRQEEKGVIAETKKQLGALWFNEEKDVPNETTGEIVHKDSYYSGKMNDKIRLLLFKNKSKVEGDENPDGFLNMGTIMNTRNESGGSAVEEKTPF